MTNDREDRLEPGQDGADARVTGERRQSSGRFVYPERRTGFDRRERYPVTSHFRDDPRRLLAVLIAINVLSLIDFAFTWVQLEAGVSTEANPVLAALFTQHPMVGWLFKTLLVLGVSLVIWRGRKYHAILMVALIALAIYSSLFVYHLVGMNASGLL